MEPILFEDREQAGARLAAALAGWKRRPGALVLGIPRGGLIVAAAAARALELPLDVYLCCKLRAPQEPDITVGAIAEDGGLSLNASVPAELCRCAQLEQELAYRRLELERRRRLFRGGRPPPKLAGRDVLLIDEEISTGATMRAAIHGLRALGPARLTAAVPIGHAASLRELSGLVDELLALERPEEFIAPAAYYRSFNPVRNEEVVERLCRRGQDAGQSRRF